MQASTRYIFSSGVVATGRHTGAPVLSALESDSVVVADQFSLREFLGEWHCDPSDSIRLNLVIDGVERCEGDGLAQPGFLTAAQRLQAHHELLSKSVNVMLYHLSSAFVHLRSLLLCYARLTSVIGPRLPFDNVTNHIFRVPCLEAYASFDAFLVSLRSFADASRYVCWQALGRRCNMPRSIRTLLRSDLPKAMKGCLERYSIEVLEDFARYRDNSVHYSPPGVWDNTLLIREGGTHIIHAQIWLPVNPEVRSFEKFTYEQKDVYKYAKKLAERSVAFALGFLTQIEQMVKGGSDGQL